MGTLLASGDVPPIVLIGVALVVLIVVVRFVIVPLLRRLGRRRLVKLLVVALAVAVLYAGVTLFFAWRTAEEFSALAGREKVRVDAARARLEQLGPMTTPLAESCATANKMQLKQLVGVFVTSELRANAFRTFREDRAVYVDNLDVPTTSPSLLAIWKLLALRPGKPAGLPSTLDYILSQKRYALVRSGERAALIDMEGDHLVCNGSLPPAPPQEANPHSKFLRPLLSLCGRIEDIECAWVTNSIDKKWD